MTDPRHEPGPDPGRTGAGADGPAGGAGETKAPWWSRPGGQWGAPQQPPEQPGPQAGAQGQPRYQPPAPQGQQAFQQHPPAQPQPPYGYGYGQPQQPPQPPAADPWSRPTTQATFPSGAQPWGAGPPDTLGAAPTPAKQGRRGVGTAAAVLATALLAGTAGGAVGARWQDGGGLLDPSASLGSPTSSASVDRAPESVAGIAAKVMQSTVSIAVDGEGGRGTGSGVVIRSDGYVLTNNHVVASAASGGTITVTFDGAEQELPAKIVGLDPVTDLAVLQVQTGEQMPAATLGQSGALVVGDPVIAIGSPLGLSGTVTTGIVSALNRTVNTPSENGQSNPLFNAIQTDAAINPGNSGGALVNARGEVVGINSAIATLGGGGSFGGEQSGGSIGVGFAIPIDEARSVAEEIIRTGKATHPSIGISANTVKVANSGQGSNAREGALIRSLTPGGAAAGAGLQVNDLIVKLDDDEVTSVDELILATREHKVGDTVTVTYVRDGRTQTTQVVLKELRRN
ncbi:MAG: peptidase and chymotrypsin/Hap [Frankiales bacterium]|nr:peptidase and chymotrypsin/Hap [Frankiales bacterium]